ncbi:c-type cytochrome biogenesis protein CcmI [Mameliella alba]|uniref:c-type cytochrome biogenesis protein CcmI n=1 Tax=Mameliella alba TaxID=561184 RepID=UPI000B536158|nr:c-type cytochrome biogenesis protein CcmI [Mameliella alba]MBY6122095.1 c-type cytochrome biogenesis protein CcmI [Mameliella alba]OWV39912.1 c-type cytochrome biogenesis protein CcmI [Mameliella alba]OWV56301.1 c-type cytochrome biogenesis protein CcmI [Mameliella alba]
MTVFWIVTTALALLCAGALVLALLRGRRATGPAEAYDLEVYRDQLKEIEADAARGKIPAEEAERLRVEISRRLLAADAKLQARGERAEQPRALGFALAAVIALVVVGGAFGLYARIGAAGYGDVPLKARLARAEEALKSRPSQATMEARIPPQAAPDATPQYLALVERLREAVKARPDDIQGHVLLTRSEAALGNFSAAYNAQAQVIRLKGDAATAKDFTDLADMMILAAGGYVSPEAQAVLEQALSRDPDNGVARYYGGLMMAQVGRPDVGFRMWNKLLRESSAQDPWVQPISDQIEDLAFMAGVQNFQMPQLAGATPRGPSAADIDAARDMTPEERQEMIRGMVSQLSSRLAEEGGPVEDWARLISSLGVIGETERAGAIYTEARTVFAQSPEALELLKGAAQRAGVAD